MDEDGLPLVGPSIEYTKVPAISQKRTLCYLNQFIIHTVHFLNRFSCVCEEKLSTLAVRIQRLETTMNILEAKLGSIPGLENITAPTPAPSSSVVEPSSQTPATASQPTAGQGPAAAPAAAPAAVLPTDIPEPPTESEKPTMTVSQDPRFAKFFKLLLVGVPAPAIKVKMSAEGLDPTVLDNPDAPAPEGNTSKAQESDEEDDFSDNDNSTSDDFSD